ncbi:sensor histidine kinase [Streptococcus pseudoporcinus]|uniref:Sensor histidine kinase n=1 Tax=Streptococcus pseudoporcinus TaxID=361101 RepID=A0A4U9ZM50_9STRE|nr:hypothetical protein [Streptococcus pseudoporcinus]VTS41269.1 sensor histidine kinase [Streptococcus pseudoporcinus]
MMSRWHWAHPLYYIPLIFLVFPIGGIYFLGYPVWTLPFTLFFSFAYLFIVHEKKSLLTNLFWLYMLTYIGYMSLVINGGMIWFFFYLNNLFVYRLKDELKGFRFLTYLGTILILLFYIFIKDFDIADQVIISVALILNLSMLIFGAME